ncbi:Smr/MutS family protein [Rufibacter sediminis]|uniref:Smr/MutS family protein n=1 Tax=Rufibacter sediminis TaxID=2762756 RepID=A0ABR6VSV6_9BACT|nr:Smr/MutS family protein [Rufibacter sediminis]MBC3540236.1 Smr/MutS family protein [Rufibacter sediminis]
MSNSEILRHQLGVFQDNLDRAVAANMHEIIFIHGTGNGVLKKEIQKVLSRNPHIKFYEDARKEKFGYGATKVQLK